KKGAKNNLEIREENNFENFWNEILIPNLFIKHQSQPVHSFDEIRQLKKLFPENIRQFNVYQNHKIVAGTTIFETNLVAHSQYISGNESKSKNGSLDFLYHYLITDFYKNKKFLDFGTSNENNGLRLNSGLNFWKESFGTDTIVQEFYEINTKNYDLLSNFLLNKS
ncbi:MAG: GNAT family N-acetyltransferase, partial [Flavobacterium sp.]|nr:GNAT family N-acetyltransferase [Flavobacterium sp.]